ncbi:MAG: hypothetical protein WBM02_10390 [bacterium]
MDERFLVKDAPRHVLTGMPASTPLASIVWRSLQTTYKDQKKQQKKRESEFASLENGLADIAEEVHKLRKFVHQFHADSNDPSEKKSIARITGIADRLAELLSKKMGIMTLSPEGEPFTEELMELFNNIAQQPMENVDYPYIIQVVTPTIMFRGAILRMGKIIIAIPISQKED